MDTASRYPLTHRALVCTRMDLFKEVGSVNALSTHGALLPHLTMDLTVISDAQAQRIVQFLFPVFLHNLIRAEDFPLRDKLSVALEQMEQTIKESADNVMVQELLTCGLTGKVFDPAGLPENIDTKRAIALFLAREEWDTLYRTFTLRVTRTLVKHRHEVTAWIKGEQAKTRIAQHFDSAQSQLMTTT